MYPATIPLLPLAASALLVGPLCGTAGAQAHGGRPEGRPLVVPLYATVRLQLSNKQPIRKVVIPKENALRVHTIVGDPTVVLVTGQQPDVVRVELTDANGRTETFEVLVQPDVEYLQAQLRRAMPTANVTLIPLSANTVLLK